MYRKSMWFGVAFSLTLFATIATAQAKIVSINFQANIGATDLLGPSEVAGYFPVANWNNLNANSGVLDGSIAGQLIDDSGADSLMKFSWGTQGGREANLPVAPATSGDQKLFRGGREGDINSGNQTTAQYLLENMNAAFPTGYSVIWYFGDSNLTFQAGFGQAYRTTNTAAFTFGNGANDPVEASLGTTIVPGNQIGTTNNVAFNGTYTFTPNGNSFLDVTLTDDAIVYSFRQKAGGSSFWGLLQTGVQIVGEPVPEPSTIALAGLGLVGLVGYGLRRRMKR